VKPQHLLHACNANHTGVTTARLLIPVLAACHLDFECLAPPNPLYLRLIITLSLLWGPHACLCCQEDMEDMHTLCACVSCVTHGLQHYKFCATVLL